MNLLDKICAELFNKVASVISDSDHSGTVQVKASCQELVSGLKPRAANLGVVIREVDCSFQVKVPRTNDFGVISIVKVLPQAYSGLSVDLRQTVGAHEEVPWRTNFHVPVATDVEAAVLDVIVSVLRACDVKGHKFAVQVSITFYDQA